MIEINQIAAMVAELLLDLADDPWRAVAHRVNPRIRPEPHPDRAGQELSPRRLHAALDPAAVDRRSAPLGVRQRNLGLPPRQRLPLALVLLARVRLHDRNHAPVDLGDDLFVETRRFRKIQPGAAGPENRPRMAERDPLDRAFADFETVMFEQLHPSHGERLIGRKIGDRPLQRPRTAARTDLRAQNERPHAAVREPILRL